MIPYPWDPDWAALAVVAIVGLLVVVVALRWRGRPRCSLSSLDKRGGRECAQVDRAPKGPGQWLVWYDGAWHDASPHDTFARPFSPVTTPDEEVRP